MAVFWPLLIVSIFVPFSLPLSSPLPSNLRIEAWAAELEAKLSRLIAEMTSVEDAQNVYKPEKFVTLSKVDGEKIRNEVLEKLGKVLERKRCALKRLVDTAEESVVYLDETYESMLSREEVPFFNMKSPPPVGTIPFSERFRQRVSFEQSGVHIPLEIFDGWMGPRYKESWWHDPQMLNGLNWTHNLDEIFKQNMVEDPAIGWQYFGSTYGFMRVYPAFRWPDHPSLPDLFDVRRRSWYLQGSVSPKDMIILIDRSGSVHGQTLDIMKITVRALLNSLGENDYVNVAWFNNQVKWVVPCIDTLVQATAQNRRLLSDAVERLTESNLTSYTAALDFAFAALRNFDEERKLWGGSNCHKAIMFLSDGGTDWPEELVTQHCNQSRTNHIKIFTFACGPHPIPTVVLKEMACATGGYFSPITALGSVRVKIQDYARVLSRPLAFSVQPDLYQWHNFYRDIGGLGMMTTVTLPVYSKKRNETSDRLLGVMGIDIPVDEMISLFPKHTLGAFGYAFSINLNGFVVFHPRLKDHIVYLEDPPDVDLLDLEGSYPEMEQVRRNMIDGELGQLIRYNSLIPVGHGHAILVKLNYFYGAVNVSTFRFGIALPSDELKAKIALPNMDEAITALQSLDGLVIAPWKFCSFKSVREELSPSELSDRIRSNLSSCDQTLVNHLLWDALHAYEIQKIWRETRSPSGIYSRFLMTTGGVSVIQPSEAAEVSRRQLDPFRNTLFKWASHATGCVLSVSRGRSYDLTAACRILYETNFVTSVIGVEMERSLVQNVMDHVTKNEKLNEDIDCSNPSQLHCHLLNDGGIVVATNQPDIRAGEFIGQHDAQILNHLRENAILGSEHRFNYHSWCSKQSYQVQPTSTGTALSKTLWDLVVSFNLAILYDFMFLLVSNFALSSSADIKEIEASNHSCVTRSSWYHLDVQFQCQPGNKSCEANARRQMGGTFSCETNSGLCERNVRVQFLPNVTALFVITTPQCDCSQRIPLESVDPQDVGPDHCDLKQPYRKRPTECFVNMPESNNTDCGAGSGSASVSSYSLNPTVLFISLLPFVK